MNSGYYKSQYKRRLILRTRRLNYSANVESCIIVENKLNSKFYWNMSPTLKFQELLRACEKCCPRKKFDFAAWNYKVGKQLSGCFEYTETSICEVSQALTIGCIGHPNVGKSSVINSIVGRKVVSTSRTPGHTKHFQTYFVTCNIQLCDCPGLVFPSIVDKQQQIFSGLYPIAQVIICEIRHFKTKISWRPVRTCIKLNLFWNWSSSGGFYIKHVQWVIKCLRSSEQNSRWKIWKQVRLLLKTVCFLYIYVQTYKVYETKTYESGLSERMIH